MAEEKDVKSLKDIGKIVSEKAVEAAAIASDSDAAGDVPSVAVDISAEAPVVAVQKLDDYGRAYATGKRKNAIARVWLKPGSGTIVINGKPEKTYFARAVLRMILNQPFKVAGRNGQYDIVATVIGGGLSGQAGAVRHGLSKALVYYEPALRGVLKKHGFLTRDSRVVERKKYGRAKARRSFQFSKR